MESREDQFRDQGEGLDPAVSESTPDETVIPRHAAVAVAEPETSTDSGVITTPDAVIVLEHTEPAEDRRRRYSVSVLLVVFGALVGYLGMKTSGSARFALSDFFSEVQLPTFTLPAHSTAVIAGVLCIAGGLTYFFVGRKYPTLVKIISAIVMIVGLVGFLCWAVADKPAAFSLSRLLTGGLSFATPLVMGALAGSLGERAGVINIAIEGQLLAGAFSSALVGSLTGSLLAALAAAAASGIFVAVLMGLFSLKYWVDQVVLGVVINMLVSGLTGFLFDVLMRGSGGQAYNSAPMLPTIKIPLLGDIPFFGEILFNQTLLVYIAYVSVVVVIFLLNRTKWGLRVRSVGEHPKAADTVGIRVNRIKWSAIMVGGIFAGLGGVFYTMCQTGSFSKDMTSGHGYIALAAVIMGRWRPGLATAMALFFGLVTQLGSQLQSFNTPIPSSFFLMLPYLATIIAVAGLIGLVRAPKADGVIYGK